MDISINPYPSPQDSCPYENLRSGKTTKTRKLEKDRMNCKKKTTPSLLITDLPPEIIQRIFRNLSFDTISKLRMVSKYFNEICSSLLSSEYIQLRTTMVRKLRAIRARMPRRESARKKHPLVRESDMLLALHSRLNFLQLTFGKHIELNYCCFFPGKVIDEIYRVLRYMKSSPNLEEAYTITDELLDLSTMAVEHFRERLSPSLPEVVCLGDDILDDDPFIAPVTGLAMQRAQLMQPKCTNIRKDVNQPKNDSATKFQKQLKRTREMAERNTRDLLKMKQTFSGAKKRINAVIKQLEEIEWQHENCKNSSFCKYSNLNGRKGPTK